jgi:nucleotide-binding universal stress UspA family protein
VFRSIVVGTNGKASSARAARHAAHLALLSDASVYLVRAYRLGLDDDAETQEDVETDLHRDVHALAAEGVQVEGYARVGGASDVILDMARWKAADLIVLGNHGMRGARRLLGSVPNHVSHHAPCAVLIVRTD